ncbi:H-type lectin domain-containing protein [Cognatishimia sp. SS12]|uniref:H-type lectin domain-containing protein n=1 Tax=Cognatishimia sp. SS12 TaxID=2979465 RepID=UPI002330E05A|nr:H-type lectin domain-containing protein [Cognatishimia sp. SS12]MDC0738849.1 H-type lectin domain-containing protein [Cognatishimia sp. SS12]
MQKLRTGTLGIDQGEQQLFSDFQNGGDMWTGTGPRERRLPIKFSEAFVSPPVVQVALSLWDVSHEANIRADIGAEKVTEAGFDLVFRTWQDSKIARVRLSWVAFGEVMDDEIWDVS